MRKITKNIDPLYNFEIISNEQTPKIVRETINEDYIKENLELFQAFLDYVKSQSTAVGLAANQCNLNGERFNQRIFAMKDMHSNKWELIIDPIILEYIGIKECKLEGCLTWKGMNICVDRFRAVKVGYYDIEGNLYHDKIFGGYQGQIFQHEYNHIEGIPEEVVTKLFKLLPQSKIGRNEKCPCDSGKKYKHCCRQYESIF